MQKEIRRLGLSAIIAAGSLVAKDLVPQKVEATSCLGPPTIVRETSSYKIYKECPGNFPKNYLVDSKTRKWFFFERTRKGLDFAWDDFVKADCTIEALFLPDGANRIEDVFDRLEFSISNPQTCDEKLKT